MSKAKLGFNGLTIDQKIARSEEIVKKLTGNADFPNVTPALATITAAIDDAKDAVKAAHAGTTAQRKTRNEKVAFLLLLMAQLTDCVNSASTDEVKFRNAGFDIKTVKKRGKRVLKALPGTQPGSIIGEAPHNNAHSHNWQYGYDPDPLSTTVPTTLVWISTPTTTAAKTTIENLTTGRKVWLRHAPVYSGRKGGAQPYSDPLSVFVP